VSFAEAVDEWLRYIEHDRKRRPSTVRDYRIVAEKVLVPAFGDAPLEAMVDYLRTMESATHQRPR
jgi:hypothetical protein